jgi:hypothetical protein
MCSPAHFWSKLIHTFYHIKSRPHFRATFSAIFYKLPKYVNNRPLGENAPNLITLAAANQGDQGIFVKIT